MFQPEKIVRVYSLDHIQEQELIIPEYARILSVAECNDGTLKLWALVNPANLDETVTIGIFHTGEPITQNVLNPVYLGSIHRKSGVSCHVFRLLRHTSK